MMPVETHTRDERLEREYRVRNGSFQPLRHVAAKEEEKKKKRSFSTMGMFIANGEILFLRFQRPQTPDSYKH
jgi:hypothetical protein